MKTKLAILLSLMLFCINSAFSQTLYQMPAKDKNGQVIEGRWVPKSAIELQIHQDFKKGAVMKAEEAVDIEGGLKKQITTWTKGNIIRVETHIYDPKKVSVRKGYKPVDITYVTVQRKP